jgi:hypothetical protein
MDINLCELKEDNAPPTNFAPAAGKNLGLDLAKQQKLRRARNKGITTNTGSSLECDQETTLNGFEASPSPGLLNLLRPMEGGVIPGSFMPNLGIDMADGVEEFEEFEENAENETRRVSIDSTRQRQPGQVSPASPI